MYHYAKTRKTYSRLNKKDKREVECPFCDDPTLRDRIVEETETMMVVPNRVSYDLFEGRHVEDHLMIIPKRHLELVKDFTEQEMLESMKLIGEYETKGYNIYARGAGSVTRSVKHQHTHLIKTNNVVPNFNLYIKKPYVLLRK